LGRLRVATKAVVRDEASGLIAAGPEEQREEGLFMLGQVATLRSAVTDLSTLHEEVSVGGTAAVERAADAIARPEPPPASPCDVAIVGMSCLLPGALSVSEYWSNIVSGYDAVRPVPD